MPGSPISPEELVAKFRAKAVEPPPEANRMLWRYLSCESSVRLGASLLQAARYGANRNGHRLDPPSELLPPLV